MIIMLLKYAEQHQTPLANFSLSIRHHAYQREVVCLDVVHICQKMPVLDSRLQYIVP